MKSSQTTLSKLRGSGISRLASRKGRKENVAQNLCALRVLGVRFFSAARERRAPVHAVAPASWSAPALWRFGHASHAVEKRQRAAAVQNLAEFRTPLGVRE